MTFWTCRTGLMVAVMALASVFLVACVPAFAQQSLWIEVVNSANESISGADVTLVTDDMTDFGTGQTDANGLLEFTGVNPSMVFTARASAPNHIDNNNAAVDYPAHGRSMDDPATIVLFRPGDPSRGDDIDPGNLSPLPPGFSSPDDTGDPLRIDDISPGSLSPVPPGFSPPAGTETFILPLDDPLWVQTLESGWTSTATGSIFLLRRCKVSPLITVALGGGWGFTGGTTLLGFFTDVQCSFSIFGGRQLNPGWSFVSYSITNGVTAGECSDNSTFTITNLPGVGATQIRLDATITGDSFGECRSNVNSITLLGPEGGDPINAFVP